MDQTAVTGNARENNGMKPDAALQKNPAQKPRVIPTEIVLPFILVTSLFALWGFANDITNPMVAAFKNILLISNAESALVQTAFYGGYCVMAFPAALFIKRFSYKSGILVGLGLYAAGCLMFIPSGWLMAFWAFLLSYFVMTCGLSFLETSSNPYILAMGPEETATRRLNFAQSFNPMGSLIGMLVAKNIILARLNTMDEAGRRVLQAADPEQFAAMCQHDLDVIIWPYMLLGFVVLVMFFVFLVVRLPRSQGEEHTSLDLGPTLKRLWRNKKYVEGVVAQTFYVGAQIMCWTFIIQYGVNEFGLSKETSQLFNMVAMAIFVTSRFICTFLLKFFSPGGLLMTLAIGGFALVAGNIFIPSSLETGPAFEQYLDQYGMLKGFYLGLVNVDGLGGMLCLVGVSACMSLMFPTIYGIALKGLGDDAKLGAAGLIAAIGGGAAMPYIQGWIMDMDAWNLGFMTLSSTRASFFLPLICFVVIAIFGFRTSNVHKHTY
ncbi:MAG: L-fucose:H+ symporter permease [Planctomycetaceae bacterium]|nr:L-fucose:H+ symporter permease [Planctomycetaceae bacterium]